MTTRMASSVLLATVLVLGWASAAVGSGAGADAGFPTAHAPAHAARTRADDAAFASDPIAMAKPPIRESWDQPQPDDPQTLYALVAASMRAHAELPALGYLPVAGGPVSSRVHITYAQLSYLVMRAARSMHALGLRAGERLMLLAPNCPEWAVSAYAANALGAVYTAMYPQAQPREWVEIVRDAQPSLLVVGNATQLEALHEAARAAGVRLPRMRVVVLGGEHDRAGLLGASGPPPDAARAREQPASARMRLRAALRARSPLGWAEFLQVGADSPDAVRLGAGGPASLCALVYTSGTTGVPKGVMLTNWNIVSNVLGAHHMGGVRAGERTASFLPWAHAFGSTLDLHFMLAKGAHLNLISDTSRIVVEAQAIRPHVMLAVPRVWATFHDRVCAAMEASPIKRRLFAAACDEARSRLGRARVDAVAVPPATRRDKLLDALVWRRVRARLGGELRLSISGAAPLAPHICDFLRMVGIGVLEGYGLSETAPLVAGNGVHGLASCARGTVGHPIPGVRVELVPPSGWAGATSAGEGELVVHGPNVMRGYWRKPLQTRRVLRGDGGFCTGDTAVWTPSGHLRITGRLKEQFKLANGRYVAPASLEESLRRAPVVAQCLVDGRGKRAPFALVVPEPGALRALLAANAVDVGDGSLRAMCAQPAAAQVVLDALRAATADPAAGWKPYERLQAVILDADEWTVGNGLLTPSLKVKRQPVLARHDDAVGTLA